MSALTSHTYTYGTRDETCPTERPPPSRRYPVDPPQGEVRLMTGEQLLALVERLDREIIVIRHKLEHWKPTRKRDRDNNANRELAVKASNYKQNLLRIARAELMRRAKADEQTAGEHRRRAIKQYPDIVGPFVELIRQVHGALEPFAILRSDNWEVDDDAVVMRSTICNAVITAKQLKEAMRAARVSRRAVNLALSVGAIPVEPKYMEADHG